MPGIAQYNTAHYATVGGMVARGPELAGSRLDRGVVMCKNGRTLQLHGTERIVATSNTLAWEAPCGRAHHDAVSLNTK